MSDVIQQSKLPRGHLPLHRQRHLAQLDALQIMRPCPKDHTGEPLNRDGCDGHTFQCYQVEGKDSLALIREAAAKVEDERFTVDDARTRKNGLDWRGNSREKTS